MLFRTNIARNEFVSVVFLDTAEKAPGNVGMCPRKRMEVSWLGQRRGKKAIVSILRERAE